MYVLGFDVRGLDIWTLELIRNKSCHIFAVCFVKFVM